MGKDVISKRTRVGASLVTVTTEIETDEAVIDYRDILEATKVVCDEDHSEAPWENDDGWKHEVEKLDGPDEWEQLARNVCYSEGHRRYIRIVVDAEEMGLTTWEYFHAKGASKGVAHQLAAKELRRAIDQLVEWYSNGWQYYGVVCKFKDTHESVWGIDDFDYANNEVRPEITDQAAAALEDEGYEIINRPADNAKDRRTAKRAELKRKLNLFNTAAR